MTPQEVGVRKLLDGAVARGERSLPRWVKVRIARLLREVEDDRIREELIEVVAQAFIRSPGLVADMRAAAESKPPVPRQTVRHQEPRGRTYKGKRMTLVNPRGKTSKEIHDLIMEGLGLKDELEPEENEERK